MSKSFLVISGTNRPNSNTIRVANLYTKLLETKGVKPVLYSLEGWNWWEKNAEFERVQAEILAPATHIIFVVPEYNGSFPGVLKQMIDISDYRNLWKGKKALLVGVSTGRAGNLRGLEHLTGILHFLKVDVHYNKLPISGVDKLRNPEGEIGDPDTVRVVNLQVEEFLHY